MFAYPGNYHVIMMIWIGIADKLNKIRSDILAILVRLLWNPGGSQNAVNGLGVDSVGSDGIAILIHPTGKGITLSLIHI